MSGPLVSIVIPCWNAKNFIGEAIESALRQTYPNTEVIVVDDGSTDASLDEIRLFENRIRWETGPNRGACAARNRGLALGCGEAVQFHDADDVLDPRKVERQLTMMNDTGVDSVFCAVGVVDTESSTRPVRIWAHASDADPVILALGSNAGTPSGLHRRSTVERAGGWDEALPCAQDRDFHLRMAIASKAVTVLPEPLALTRRRQNSLSSDPLKVVRQYPRILDRARSLLETQGAWIPARALAMAVFASRSARTCAELGALETAEALWLITESFQKRGLPLAYGPTLRPFVHLFGPRLVERGVHVWRAASLSLAREAAK